MTHTAETGSTPGTIGESLDRSGVSRRVLLEFAGS